MTKKEADGIKRHFDQRAGDISRQFHEEAGDIRRHFHKEVEDVKHQFHNEAEDVKRHFDQQAGDIKRHFHEEAGDIKRHFDVVVEHMDAQHQQLAEGIGATSERIDRLETEMRRGFSEMGSLMKLSYGQLDRRLTRVEADGAETRAEVEKLKAKLA